MLLQFLCGFFDMQLLAANCDTLQSSTHYSLQVKLVQVLKTNLNVTDFLPV